jgi:hypothetical protein
LEDANIVTASGVHGEALRGDDSDQTKRWKDLLMQGNDGFCLEGVDLLQAMELADNDADREDEDIDVWE